jgi:hypothetical protein
MKSLLRKKLYFFAGTERPTEAPGTALKICFLSKSLKWKAGLAPEQKIPLYDCLKRRCRNYTPFTTTY